MQIQNTPDPVSPSSMVAYDNAKCSGGTDMPMHEGSSVVSLTYYGPIPVYENLFFEQLSGGRDSSNNAANSHPQTPGSMPWNFRHQVQLTPLGSETEQSCNFAHHHTQAAVSSF